MIKKIKIKYIKTNYKFINKIMELVRFGIVGVIATLIHYGVYMGLMSIMNSYNITYTLGYIVSFVFNFIASNYFTFKVKPTVKRGGRFIIAHAINYSIQIILLNIFISISIPREVAPIIVFCITILINFFMVRKSLVEKE